MAVIAYNDLQQKDIINPTAIYWDCSNILNSKGKNVFWGTQQHSLQVNNHFLEMLNKNSESENQSSETYQSTSKLFTQHIQKLNYESKKISIDIAFNNAKEKIEKSLSQLLKLNVDAFSSELTYDSSVFFTLIKNSYAFYLEQFLINDEDDDVEFVLTAFDDKSVLYNSSGSLSYLIQKINSTLDIDMNEPVLTFSDELSY